MILDIKTQCQISIVNKSHLAPLFQCIVPTPVIVPNRHSPEKNTFENIAQEYIHQKTPH